MEKFLLENWRFLAFIVACIIYIIRTEWKCKLNTEKHEALKKDFSKNQEDSKKEKENFDNTVDAFKNDLNKIINDSITNLKKDLEKKDEELKNDFNTSVDKIEKKVDNLRLEENKAKGHIYDKVDRHLELINKDFLRKADAKEMFKSKG